MYNPLTMECINVPARRAANDIDYGRSACNTTTLERAARIVRRGGVVAFPTETVYGLGADVFNVAAIARLFEIKGRPRFDPLIVHLADPATVDDLARDVPDTARTLMRRFWPGPLTLVLTKRDVVPDLVTADLPSVALRMPAQDLALDLIRMCGVPLAAPSANRFGCTSPTTAAHVRAQLGDAPDMLIDAGACPVGVESTVVGFDAGGRVILYRAGGVCLEELVELCGPLSATPPAMADGSKGRVSPGLIERHYAPRTKLCIGAKPPKTDTKPQRWGWIGLFPPADTEAAEYVAVEALSEKGDTREAAAALFAALHRLDAAGLDGIVAQLAPEEGLGRAINDRLRRAAAPR